MHALPADRDEVRPLGGIGRATSLVHRAATAALLLAAIVFFPLHPLVSLVLGGMALGLVMDRRQAFGAGMGRAILAFVSGLLLIILGVITTLLGLVPGGIPCESPDCPAGPGNFLLIPGLLVLVSGLGVFGWSVISALRLRGLWR